MTIDEAARLTGESAQTWWRKALKLSAEDPPLAWMGPSPRGGKPCWWVARKADGRLANRKNLPAELGRYPKHAIDRAQQRKAWLDRYHDECRRHARKGDAAAALVKAIKLEEPGAKISASSLRAWDRKYREVGFIALLGGYSYADKDPIDPKDEVFPGRSPEAQSYFDDLYLTQQRRPITLCHEMTVREAGHRGWTWPRSYSSAREYVNGLQVDLVDLARMGWTYYYRHHLQYTELSYKDVKPGAKYVADSHDLKAFVRWWDGSIVRPVLVANMDAGSRILVGHAWAKTTNEQTVLSVLRKSCVEWAIPTTQKVDNGRDYDARTITGITKQQRLRGGKREAEKFEASDPAWRGVLPELGVRISFAKPFNPRAKVVERVFKTITDRFTCQLATFCGTSPEEKPEDLKEVMKDRAAIPHISEVIEQFQQWVDGDYHVRAHRGDGMELQSPLAVWHGRADSLQKADPEALTMLCRVRGACKVGQNGVGFKVGSTTIRYGRDDPALRRWKGREVLVAADEGDMREIWCFTPDRERRKLICVARMNERISANEPVKSEVLREANRRVEGAKRDVKRGRQKGYQAMMGSARMAKTVLSEQARETEAERRKIVGDADPPTIAPVETGFEGAMSNDQQRRFDDAKAARLMEALAQPAEPAARDAGPAPWEILERLPTAPSAGEAGWQRYRAVQAAEDEAWDPFANDGEGGIFERMHEAADRERGQADAG